MPTLMIVDDEALSRFNLRTLISRNFDDVTVVCEAEDGAEAVEKYFEHRPDGVIMDIRIPGMSGLVASRQILEGDPRAAIVICSAYDNFSLVSQALDIGVKGYMLKPVKKDDLAEKVCRLFGGTYSPIEALAEQRILEMMTSGGLADPLRRDLNRYYGDIEHGLMIAINVDEPAGEALRTQIKRHAPRLGYALTGRIGPLTAAFLSPVRDADALMERIKKIVKDVPCAFAPVDGGDWARAWAQAGAQPARRRGATLMDALDALIYDDKLGALSLETLAVQLGVSPQHLSTSFKEQRGMNFINYITLRRMELAARLIDSGISTADVAQRCGYSDTAYFKKLFRRAHGMSPHMYHERTCREE